MPGIITLQKLIELICLNPAKRFGLETGLEPGCQADFTVFDLEHEYTIDPDEFLSKGKATPFEGWKVFGRCLATVCGGQVVYEESGRKETVGR